jgi:hypothetical protein
MIHRSPCRRGIVRDDLGGPTDRRSACCQRCCQLVDHVDQRRRLPDCRCTWSQLLLARSQLLPSRGSSACSRQVRASRRRPAAIAAAPSKSIVGDARATSRGFPARKAGLANGGVQLTRVGRATGERASRLEGPAGAVRHFSCRALGSLEQERLQQYGLSPKETAPPCQTATINWALSNNRSIGGVRWPLEARSNGLRSHGIRSRAVTASRPAATTATRWPWRSG